MSPIGGGKTIDLLTVKIGADIDEALKGLDEIGAKVRPFAAGFTAAAAAAAAAGTAIAAVAIQTGRWADELLDLRDQTGLTLRELQEFRVVGISAGVGADTVAEAVLKLQTRMASGAEGSADLRMGLEQLGVSLEDWTGKSRPMGDIVTEIVGKLGDMEDVTQRNVTATRVFGRGAVELLPVLAMGSAEIEKVTDRAHRMGLVMSNEDVEAANELRIEFDLAVESIAAMGRELSVQTIPLLLRLGEVMGPVLENLRLLATQATGGPSVAAQGIIGGFSGIDDIGALQQRYMMFFDRLPGVAAAAGQSIDEIQAGLDEFGITGADLGHILFALEEQIAGLATTTTDSVAPSFGEFSARSVELQLNLDRLKVTIPELADAQQLWTEWMQYGMEITEAVRTPLEVYNDTLQELDLLLRINAISQETHARAVRQATAALNAQAAAAANDADELSELAGQLGKVGSLMSILGPSLPGLGQVTGLLNLFAGGFADGGTIPGGQWGIVGERGPEIVSGPANITPMGGGAGVAEAILERLGPPPQAMTPDAVAAHRWYRSLFAAQVDFARHDGVRI